MPIFRPLFAHFEYRVRIGSNQRTGTPSDQAEAAALPARERLADELWLVAAQGLVNVDPARVPALAGLGVLCAPAAQPPASAAGVRTAYLKQQSAKERATKRSEREAKAKQRQTARELDHANRERRRSAIEQRRSEFVDIARRRSRRLNTTGPRDIQAQDDDVYVKVKNGYDRRSDEYTTDIIIAYRDKRIPFHHHFVIDEQGRVVIDEKRRNR